jgi:hypothetical protein
VIGLSTQGPLCPPPGVDMGVGLGPYRAVPGMRTNPGGLKEPIGAKTPFGKGRRREGSYCGIEIKGIIRATGHVTLQGSSLRQGEPGSPSGCNYDDWLFDARPP